MTTIINNPDTGGGGSGAVVAVLVLVLIGFGIYLLYGSQLIGSREDGGDTTITIPDEINVEVSGEGGA